MLSGTTKSMVAAAAAAAAVVVAVEALAMGIPKTSSLNGVVEDVLNTSGKAEEARGSCTMSKPPHDIFGQDIAFVPSAAGEGSIATHEASVVGDSRFRREGDGRQLSMLLLLLPPDTVEANRVARL